MLLLATLPPVEEAVVVVLRALLADVATIVPDVRDLVELLVRTEAENVVDDPDLVSIELAEL